MSPVWSLSIGLTSVSLFLLLALIAELYYLLCWKRKKASNGDVEDGCIAPTRKMLYLCRKRPSSLSSACSPAINHQEVPSFVRVVNDHDPEDGQCCIESSSTKDLILKPFDEEESLEAELIRVHGLLAPPRLLSTIKEETNEDLESEDGRSTEGVSRKVTGEESLCETPFMTPLSSPPFFTPPMTPLGCYSPQGFNFNPLFECSKEDEIDRVRIHSPPPKLKFLKEAEEKLYRKTLMEEALRLHKTGGFVGDLAKTSPSHLKSAAAAAAPSPPTVTEEEEGSFITIVVGKHRERSVHQHQHHPGSSQVIPLASSPTNVRKAHGKQQASSGFQVVTAGGHSHHWIRDKNQA